MSPGYTDKKWKARDARFYLKNKWFLVYKCNISKMGCRMNTEEYINIYFLKIVNQQVKCRALEMLFDLHNTNSHGAANLFFKT